jgi:NodT family efflux transporter outer membrane factor (OMF) lipoprotein
MMDLYLPTGLKRGNLHRSTVSPSTNLGRTIELFMVRQAHHERQSAYHEQLSIHHGWLSVRRQWLDLKPRRLKFIATVFITLLVSGCAVGPDYQTPKMPVPTQWQGGTHATAHSDTTQAEQWWRTFNDPILNQLIADAIIANLDIKQALVRVRDARAQRTATFASALPSATVKSNVSRRLNNSSSGTQSGGAGGVGVGSQLINIFQTGFDAQWELDFFGGVRRAVEAADATVEAEVENSRAVRVTLLGEVARHYIELRANQQLLAITHDNVTTQQDTLTLTEVRQQAGFASMLEVAQARAQVAMTEAQLPTYDVNVQQAIYALSVLLGREPSALIARLNRLHAIPAVTTLPIPELPSELLQRRPDIRRAERQLAVANAFVGIATAELYPRVNLSAFLGLQNMRITDVTPIGKSWSTAASVSLPLFNWGRIKATIKSKEAQSELAFLNYQSTVLGAFKEVEDALIRHQKEQQHHHALNQAVSANQLAVQLAKERYQQGLTSFLEVLITQNALYQAQSNRVESEAEISSNLVALYKALGGGWGESGAGKGG